MAYNGNEMKTSLFGGFKKSDVITYIEKLQTETAEINAQLDQKRKESIDLRKQINELSSKVNELSALADQATNKDREIEALKAELNAAKQDSLLYKDQVLQLQSKSERLNNAEKQIGAAYIEARRFSDEIIENAKLKAKDVGAIASQDVKHQANEIEQLLRDVDAVSKKFNTSLEQLHKDVYALSTKLNISASSLLNLHTELPALETPLIYEESAQDNVIDSSDSQITEKTTEESSNDNTNLEELAEKYNVEDNTQSVSLDTETTENETVEERADIPEEIAKEMPDAIGVEETNDGSGLTYISYEPNSEFNEDLNIQPDSFMDNEENNE